MFGWVLEPEFGIQCVTGWCSAWMKASTGERGVFSVRDDMDMTLELSFWVAVNQFDINA